MTIAASFLAVFAGALGAATLLASFSYLVQSGTAEDEQASVLRGYG